MGSQQAKEARQEEKVALVDASTDIHESSSGMHLLEIHTPTGGLAVIIIVFAVALWFILRRYLNRRMKKKSKRSCEPGLYDVEAVVDQRLRRMHQAYLARGGVTRTADEDRFEEIFDDAGKGFSAAAMTRCKGLGLASAPNRTPDLSDDRAALVAAAAAAAAAAVANPSHD